MRGCLSELAFLVCLMATLLSDIHPELSIFKLAIPTLGLGLQQNLPDFAYEVDPWLIRLIAEKGFYKTRS